MSEESVRRLGYHPVRGLDQGAVYEANRHLYMGLFEHVESVGPDSPEKSLALTALQESLMWLNAHVACNDVEF